jgi:luciferase family oxidoreductase group 1
VLDFGRVEDGSTVRATVEESIRLAVHADRLGFGRYWLAEHHAPRSAWGSPIPLLPRIGAATERLRVGSGGTLLRYHDPYAVASDVALLSCLFPGRVDLGLARGRPSIDTGQIASDEQPGSLAGEYAESVQVVTGLLSFRAGGEDWKSGWPRFTVPAVCPPPPECWLLGTSTESARIAAAIGAPFGCTLLHRPNPDVAAIGEYRSRFTPGLERRPRVSVAVAGLCAETDAGCRKGLAERILSTSVHPAIVGTPAQCHDLLAALDRELEPDLILFLDVTRGAASRAHSLELLAAVLG